VAAMLANPLTEQAWRAAKLSDQGSLGGWRLRRTYRVIGSVTTLWHDLQRKMFAADNPPGRRIFAMNCISAPHCSHFRMGASSVLSVPIAEQLYILYENFVVGNGI